MATPIKVTVIGAGSAQFSLGLVKDLCLTENLNGSMVSFMDIDEDRLAMIHKMGERYATELGADLRFESTTDRQKALQDADFVINTAAVQSHHHQRTARLVKRLQHSQLGPKTGHRRNADQANQNDRQHHGNDRTAPDQSGIVFNLFALHHVAQEGNDSERS